MAIYTPADWYWIDGKGAVYGSARNGLVASPSSDSAYLAFQASGAKATPLPSDDFAGGESTVLDEVLTAAAMPVSGLAPQTKAQLLAYANGKVKALLLMPRSYTVAGLSGPVIDDCGGETAITMNTTQDNLANLTYPFTWSDDNYALWSMTQTQLQAFLAAAFTYSASVWAVMNGTVIPQIQSGAITTTSAIDALSWPA